MTSTPDFANPPIVELVLGVQFSPITKLTAGHYGLFWKELGNDWEEPADAQVIDDQFELFDRPQWITPANIPFRLQPRFLGRFTLGHRDKSRLLQMQPTRFHLNWRKREGHYPSYKRLIAEFEELYSRFIALTQRFDLGTLALNQWEVTYIDAFPREDYWNTPGDWGRILPGLFGPLFSTDGLNMVLEHREAEWTGELEPKRGRLHIVASPGKFGDDKRDALLLQMTARGPLDKGGIDSLRAGLDLGHAAAVGAFLRVVSDDAKKNWGTIP